MPRSPDPLPRSSDPLSRVLLHLRESTSTLLEHVPESAAGAVLPAGPVPPQHRWTVGSGRPRPLVLDPARYRTETATPRHPFRFTPPSLFNPEGDPPRALAELDRWSAPFDLVLTPTGLLTCDKAGIQALMEAVRLVEDVRTHRLVLAVPLGPGWLTATGAQVLAALLDSVRIPKALVLDAEHSPVDSVERLRALRCVVTESPDTAVLGPGLAALDALAHGASFVSFDETTTAVDAKPYPGEPFPPASPVRPGILHRRLLTYLAGPTATVHLEGLGRCCCEPCLRWGEERGHGQVGRPYSVLGQEGSAEAAHAHNLAVVSDVARELTRGLPDVSEAEKRGRWWRLCFEAVRAHDWHNGAADPALPPLDPPEELLFWAGYPER
ncbi:hypothetical protein [Nocardiopsis xinjiangensis]|uniref:hypothetical protein n=1 Tax=Nocardiopsis xinjiangensis TaxID=124285 RepID=UPI000348F776|nr:hypothetical protein [Nocardiopsis xinjiangensis]